MDDSKFDAWVKKILATEEAELSCSQCFDLVSDYVDAELSGAEIQGTLRRVKQHLDQCLACRDEYELLHDLVKSESNQLDSE